MDLPVSLTNYDVYISDIEAATDRQVKQKSGEAYERDAQEDQAQCDAFDEEIAKQRAAFENERARKRAIRNVEIARQEEETREQLMVEAAVKCRQVAEANLLALTTELEGHHQAVHKKAFGATSLTKPDLVDELAARGRAAEHALRDASIPPLTTDDATWTKYDEDVNQAKNAFRIALAALRTAEAERRAEEERLRAEYLAMPDGKELEPHRLEEISRDMAQWQQIKIGLAARIVDPVTSPASTSSLTVSGPFDAASEDLMALEADGGESEIDEDKVAARERVPFKGRNFGNSDVVRMIEKPVHKDNIRVVEMDELDDDEENVSSSSSSESFNGSSSVSSSSVVSVEHDEFQAEVHDLVQSNIKCSWCPEIFLNNRSMRVHVGHRHPRCDLCPQRFASSDLLREHRRTAHAAIVATEAQIQLFVDQELMVVTSQDCYMSLNRIWTMYTNWAKEQTPPCPLVFVEFARKFRTVARRMKGLKVGTLGVHGIKSKKKTLFTPPSKRKRAENDLGAESDEDSPSPPTKRVHLSSHYCLECTLNFKDDEALEDHMVVVHHHPQRPRTQVIDDTKVCEVCQAILPGRAEWRMHMKQNHAEALYNCQRCNNKFPSSGCLRSHIYEYHPKCTICKEVFKNRADYHRHREDKHPERVLKCPTCGNGFVSRSRYDMHVAKCVKASE